MRKKPGQGDDPGFKRWQFVLFVFLLGTQQSTSLVDVSGVDLINFLILNLINVYIYIYMNVQVVILGYSYRQVFRHIIDVNHASSATATLPKINICLYPKMIWDFRQTGNDQQHVFFSES